MMRLRPRLLRLFHARSWRSDGGQLEITSKPAGLRYEVTYVPWLDAKNGGGLNGRHGCWVEVPRTVLWEMRDGTGNGRTAAQASNHWVASGLEEECTVWRLAWRLAS